jgi:hypothetical protein
MKVASLTTVWRPAGCSYCDGAERVPADRMPVGQEVSVPMVRRTFELIEPEQTNTHRHECRT